MENKALTRFKGMLGFAMRAGKVLIGTDLVCSALSKKGNGAVVTVLICDSASDGTKKKIYNKCEFYAKELRVISTDPSELGSLLGKTYSPMVLGITDAGFADEIRKALDSIGAPISEKSERKEVSY